MTPGGPHLIKTIHPLSKKKGSPGKRRKTTPCAFSSGLFSPDNRGVIPWNEEDPEKLFPLEKKASSKAPYPVNGASFPIYALKQAAFLHVLLMSP